MTETTESDPQTPIVAKAGRYYRNTRFVMSLACFLAAGWFGLDGFVKWPEENLNYDRVTQQLSEAQAKQDSAAIESLSTEQKNYHIHSDLDLLFQKSLAMGLPVIGLALLSWTLYNSRGKYRLEDGIIYAPSHPPIPVGNTVRIDSRLWDKKGIANIDYVTESGETATFRLDDFVYQAKPIRAIYKAIEADILARATPEDESEQASAE